MVDNKIMAAAKNEKYEHNKEIGSYKKDNVKIKFAHLQDGVLEPAQKCVNGEKWI